MLTVRALGRIEVAVDGGVRELPSQGRARSLLGLLVVDPGPHPRSELSGRLRPDVLDESARKSLRQAIWGLRRALGPGAEAALLTTREHVGLARDEDVEVDLWRFRRLRAEGALEAAAALATGELLPGLDDEWVYAARDQHRAEVADVLERLAREAETVGDLERAIAWTRRQGELDPLAERVHRELMRRLAAAGDRAAALTAYEALADRLRRELETIASPETRALADTIRRGGGASRTPPHAVATGAAAPSRPLPPLPEPLSRSDPFVGREATLARLAAALADAETGTPRFVTLEGEAGIGKTRLCAEFARRAHDAGAVVLYGRASEDTLVPYEVFVDALSRDTAALGDDERAGPPAGETAGLAPLLPGLAANDEPARGDPATLRYRTFDAVRSLLAGLAERQPAVLVLDDLHWADEPSLRLVRHLASGAGRTRLLLLATLRPGGAVAEDPVADALADVRREQPLIRLTLDGLDEDEIGELMASSDGEEPPEEIARAIRDRTRGNPFFATELIRLARGEGAGAVTPDGLEGLPPGVLEVVGRRVRALGEAAVEVLTVASLMGLEFELDPLERTLGDRGDRALDALEAAAAAGLVDEVPPAGRFRFRHALVADSLSQTLSAARRMRLHRRIGDALAEGADAGSRAAEIAAHFVAAAAEGREPALEWSIRAGEAATRALAFEDAAQHLTTAIELLRLGAPDEATEARLLVRLGDARARAGAVEQARRSFEEAASLARGLGDAPLLAEAALGRGGLAVAVTAVDPEYVALVEEALQALGDREVATRARLLARLALEVYYGDRARSEALSAEAVALARGADPGTLSFALNAHRVALWDGHRLSERLAVSDEITELGRRAGNREAELQGRNWRIVDLLELGRVDETRAEIDRYERMADATRLPHHRWYVPLWRSTLATFAGRFAEAAELTDRALALGRRAGDPNAENFAWIQRLAALEDQWRFDEMDVDRALEATRHAAEPAAFEPWMAKILASIGQTAAAAEWFERIAGDDFARLPRGVNWHTIVEAAEACALLGDARRAERLTELLSPCAALNAVVARAVAACGSTEFYLARLAATAGRPDEAARRYELAIAENARLGALPRLALTRIRHAELLAGLGPARFAEAATQFSKAIAGADELGLDRLAAHARAGLAALPPD